MPDATERYSQLDRQIKGKLLAIQGELFTRVGKIHGYINWADVGDLAEVDSQLDQVLRFLQGRDD